MPEISKFNGGFAGFSATSFSYTPPGGGGGGEGDVDYTGSTMLFVQTAAPTGWTKDTSIDNYALRVTDGTPTDRTNGVSFTTAFALITPTGTGTTTLTTAPTALTDTQIPSHTHSLTTWVTARTISQNPYTGGISTLGSYLLDQQAGGNTPGGAATGHIHGPAGGVPVSLVWTGTNMDMRIRYVDSILATKD